MPARRPVLRTRTYAVNAPSVAHPGMAQPQLAKTKAGVRASVAEREQRRRVEVGRPAVLRPERRLQVRPGLPARIAGDLHRQPPARRHPPGQHPGDRPTTLLTRQERLDQAGGPTGERPQCVRAARDGHDVKGSDSGFGSGPDADFLKFVYGVSSNAGNFAQSWDQALSPTAAETLLDQIAKLFQLQVSPQQWVDNMNKVIGK